MTRARGRGGVQRTDHGAGALWVAVLGGLAAALVGCAGPAPSEPLPSLAALRPRVTEPSNFDTRPGSGFVTVAQITLVDVPWRADLSDAWKQVDTAALPAGLRQVWESNGLRIGVVVGQKALTAFIKGLREATNTRTIRVFAGSHLEPLVIVPHPAPALTLDLCDADGNSTPTSLPSGRYQFLVRVGAGMGGAAPVELVPHLYIPKPSLMPRSPLQTMYDGRIFYDLDARLGLVPGQLLVIGIEPPQKTNHDMIHGAPPPPAAHHPSADHDHSRAAGSEAQPASPPRRDTRFPPLLGSMLLGKMQFGKPMQTIMLVAVGRVTRAVGNAGNESSQ